MEYFPFIQSVVAFIENRITEHLSSENFMNVTGLSYAHIRDIFKQRTNLSLGKYISRRKIAHGAYRLIHSDRSILEIALDLGFESHDTFTRAFKRVTGMNPRDFRRCRYPVGRRMITAGIFGPSLKMEKLVLKPILEDHMQRKQDTEPGKQVLDEESSCILYGVDKVAYTKELTPFPACLRSVLNYMGQAIDYRYLMAASGAAFRLRWRTSFWDGGNVDIMYIYENPWEAFERSFKAAGRDYSIIKRTEDTQKAEFIQFIRHEVDHGRPLIALGIIGPPEACIITGYRDNGETLLGWNFFQEMPDFSKDVVLDESGYFISKTWWENPETTALMSIGEEITGQTDIKDLLANAIVILTKETNATGAMKDVAGGQAAFDAWKTAILDDSEFPDTLPMLFERLMCQMDAMTMIGEGRYLASEFIKSLGEDFPEIKRNSLKAAEFFKQESDTVHVMGNALGGFAQGEAQARNLQKPEVRQIIAREIKKAKDLESLAAGQLQQILNILK